MSEGFCRKTWNLRNNYGSDSVEWRHRKVARGNVRESTSAIRVTGRKQVAVKGRIGFYDKITIEEKDTIPDE